MFQCLQKSVKSFFVLNIFKENSHQWINTKLQSVEKNICFSGLSPTTYQKQIRNPTSRMATVDVEDVTSLQAQVKLKKRNRWRLVYIFHLNECVVFVQNAVDVLTPEASLERRRKVCTCSLAGLGEKTAGNSRKTTEDMAATWCQVCRQTWQLVERKIRA